MYSTYNEGKSVVAERFIRVGLYGSFERKKGSREANLNTLKNTKITIFKKAPFFNVTKT